MAVCTQLDYHLYRRWSIIILIISFLLLGLLLFPGLPFVETINNATRWILIGPITIMPGEIAKIAVIIFYGGLF